MNEEKPLLTGGLFLMRKIVIDMEQLDYVGRSIRMETSNKYVIIRHE